MPGMEMAAPERTASSSGFVASPKVAPVARPVAATASRMSASRPSGRVSPLAKKWRHTIGETRVAIRMFGAEPIDPSWHRAAVSADVTLTRTRAPCCVHDNRDARASRHRLRMLA